MDEKTLWLLKQSLDSTISNYFWWIIIAASAFFFKNLVESIVTGLTFYYGRDYNVDDEVILPGNRKARIVRQTITKTTFYIYEGNRRLVVPNRDLPSLRIETVLRTELEQTGFGGIPAYIQKS
jgi:hypothetical protein